MVLDMSETIYDPYATSDEDDLRQTDYGTSATTVVDPYDTDDDSVNVESHSVETEAKNSRPARKSAPRKASPRRGMLDAIARFKEVSQMGDSDRASLAALLGVTDSNEEIAVALATGVKPNTQSIDDIISIYEADDDFSAGIDTMTLIEKKRFGAAWSLLSNHVAISDTPPRNDAAAAKEFARAVRSMSSTEVDDLRAPLSVLG